MTDIKVNVKVTHDSGVVGLSTAEKQAMYREIEEDKKRTEKTKIENAKWQRISEPPSYKCPGCKTEILRNLKKDRLEKLSGKCSECGCLWEIYMAQVNNANLGIDFEYRITEDSLATKRKKEQKEWEDRKAEAEKKRIESMTPEQKAEYDVDNILKTYTSSTITVTGKAHPGTHRAQIAQLYRGATDSIKEIILDTIYKKKDKYYVSANADIRFDYVVDASGFTVNHQSLPNYQRCGNGKLGEIIQELRPNDYRGRLLNICCRDYEPEYYLEQYATILKENGEEFANDVLNAFINRYPIKKVKKHIKQFDTINKGALKQQLKLSKKK